jgi:glutamate 5-kinase
VANLIAAETLIILTDQQGLYTADPRQHPEATLISEGKAEDRQYEAMAGGAGSGISKGGMITKIRAAQRAARSGAHTCIASGREPDPLLRLAAGEAIGTLLYASSTPLQARKQWLADHLQLAGDLIIDDGAILALKSGRSLLPVGVIEVRGEFRRGAIVACRSTAGEEVARGLVNYSSAECRRIARKPSTEIESALGYLDEPELVHRDNMVVR